MKYLSKYKTFEKIHPLNTNILELDPQFVSDIKHICLDLVDELNLEKDVEELVAFYSTHFRKPINMPYPEYPSISVRLPYFTYGYIFGERDSNFNPAKDCTPLKEVALRIKDYLGEAFIAFVVPGGGNLHHCRTQKLDIDTNLYSGINGFEIVYDPKLLN